MSKHSKRRVLDLFAGTGISVAVKRLGAVEFGVEIMKEAIASRAANNFTTVYEDVWDADKAEGLDFDTLWASPPCQSFSMTGKGSGRKALDNVLGIISRKQYIDLATLREQSALLGDERIGLVLSPLHYAHRFLPTFLAFEQVPPVLPVWEAMAVELRKLGYSVWTGMLSTEQYGVPQARKRAILMARRDGVPVSAPTPTHSKYHARTPEKLDAGVQKWVSMFDALGWGFKDQPAPTVTGGGGKASGIELFDQGSRWKLVNKIAAGEATGNNRVVNPNTPLDGVRITIPEAASLQTYDSNFEFSGSRGKQFLQIGNAVPPKLAEAVLASLWNGSAV